jgi:PhzF family phenazine biosynthesis protein
MEQSASAYEAVSPDGIAPSLGLPSAALSIEHPPIVASTGNRFLLIRLRDRSHMSQIQPRFADIEAISERYDLIGYYVWVPGSGDFAATTRMFAPRYGIPEESGTGMAAGPLACYLNDRCGVSDTTMLIEQGAFMQPRSPSRIVVRMVREGGRITSLYVGGRARMAGHDAATSHRLAE